MRTISFLICLIGAVASEPLFSSGKEYEFQYQGKILSGIPALDSQFAGLVIKSKIIVQALDDQHYKLALKNVEFNKFNERLSGPEPMNWRTLETPETQSVPSKVQSALESPIQFSMVNGQITQIKISENEPRWILNFKKSLISLLKIKTTAGEHDLSQNTVRRQGGSLPTVWKTMEQGVDGKCENSYLITEVPEYMLADLAPKVAESRRCEGQKVFQITKSRNVNKCVERAVYQVNQPGKYLCHSGNCDTMWGRSSLTRYIGCGSAPESMDIQVIVNEGEIQQNLMGFNTENVVTGTKQVLRVVEIRSSMSSLPEIQSPRTVEDLLYEYPKTVGSKNPNIIQASQNKNFKEQQKNLQNQNQNPTTQRFQPSLFNDSEDIVSQLSSDSLKQRIVDSLTKIIEYGREGDSVEKRPLSEMTFSATKAFSLLSTQQMTDLYEQIRGVKMEEKDQDLLRQLVLEVAAMAGTNPSIMFMKSLIEKEEFSPLRIGATLATIPHYIRTPTVKILDQIFELIQSPVITKNRVLKTNAQLAFATLVNRACIDTNRERRFPIYVFGDFCTTETSEINSKYIPYFVDQLHSAKAGERKGLMLALGSLGHESVIPILMPYVEGKSQGSTPLEQRIAVYSLSTLSKQHRNTLLPVFSALVHNPSEDRSVRIAALSLMMSMDPSMVYFQKLATSTWFEKDNEFQKFVFSTLKSLSEIKIAEQPIYGTLYKNSQKARIVLHLAKPIPVAITSTLNFFTAEWLKEMQIGYQFHGFYNTVSGMQGVYAKLEYVMQKLKFSPLEFSVNFQGTRSLWETIQEQLRPGQQNEEKVHPEWKNIAAALNIQQREDAPFGVSMWAQVLNDVQFRYGMNMDSVKPMLKAIKQGLSHSSSWKDSVCGKTPINLVKVDNFSPTEIIIPSEMGLPILIEYNMPTGLYMRGDINVDCSESVPSMSLNLRNQLSTSVTGYVGTICPFTEEIIAVGVNKHWTVNYPTKMSMKMELGKLRVVYSPADNVRSGPVDTWSFTVKPFATIKPMVFIDLTPISAHANTKIIRSRTVRKTEQFPMGESLGLDMKYEITTETDLRDRANLMNTLSLYKNNPLNVMLFSWTHSALRVDGKPSCRYHNVKMVLDLSSSTTKEVEIEISASLGFQKNAQQPQIVRLNVDQQSQNPIQIQSQQIDASNSEHQKIQQVMQNLNVEQGLGLATSVKMTLKGGAPKTFHWVLSAGKGLKGLDSKWNLNLENKNRLNICIDGSMTYPTNSIRNVNQLQSEEVRATFKNNIGFGQTCEEHKITVTGSAVVSHDQKERAQNSIAAQKCEQASRQVNEIREQLRNVREESQESRRLEQQLVLKVQQKRESCKQQIQKLSTLDQVKVNIRYTDMPEYVERYARYADVLVKSYLIPFMSSVDQKSNQNEIDFELKFNPKMETFDAILSSGKETIKYHNIRLNMISALPRILPMFASQQLGEQVLSAIQMAPVYPTCRVGDGVIKSFDNKTYSYELDDCYHVLATECKKNSNHAVLAKKVNGKLSVKIFTHESKISMAPAGSYSESRKEYNVEVDGRQVSISKNEKKEVQSQDHKSQYRFYRSSDDVLVLETPYSRITYDGKDIEVLHTDPTMDAHHCGLCGNRDGDRRGDIANAQQLQVSNPKAAALSFRVNDQCSELTQQQQKIKAQGVNSINKQVEKSPVSNILRGNLEKCSQMKHLIIRQSDKVCFSQLPIVECGSGCSPRSTAEKQIAFSCLPADRRVTRHYEERARQGEVLPELRNMEKTFSSKIEIPTGCAHPGL